MLTDNAPEVKLVVTHCSGSGFCRGGKGVFALGGGHPLPRRNDTRAARDHIRLLLLLTADLRWSMSTSWY